MNFEQYLLFENYLITTLFYSNHNLKRQKRITKTNQIWNKHVKSALNLIAGYLMLGLFP